MSLIVGLTEFNTRWQNQNTTWAQSTGAASLAMEGKVGVTVGGQTFPQKKENEHIISLQPDELTDTILTAMFH